MNFLKSLLVIILFVAINSCKKDAKEPSAVTEEPKNESGNLQIFLDNMVGNESLSFGKNFVNYNGDTFKVSKLNYYVSNIVLIKSDNSTFSEENSYHLIKHSNSETSSFTIKGLPAGSYKSIKLMIGVDSTRNVSGVQSGDLDPVVAADMFWSWNSGYIFFKLEGTAPKSGDPGKALEYHIGGYGGANKAQRSLEIGFGSQEAKVTTATTPVLHLKTDVNQLFTSPVVIDLSVDFRSVSPTTKSKRLADNYADMISFKSLDN